MKCIEKMVVTQINMERRESDRGSVSRPDARGSALPRRWSEPLEPLHQHGARPDWAPLQEADDMDRMQPAAT